MPQHRRSFDADQQAQPDDQMSVDLRLTLQSTLATVGYMRATSSALQLVDANRVP